MRSASGVSTLRALGLSKEQFLESAPPGALLAVVLGLHGGSRRTIGGPAVATNRLALTLDAGKVYVAAGSAGTGTGTLDFWIEEEHINTSNKKRRTTFSVQLGDEPPVGATIEVFRLTSPINGVFAPIGFIQVSNMATPTWSIVEGADLFVLGS